VSNSKTESKSRPKPNPPLDSRRHPKSAIAVAFRRHTLLPLDDCLYALQATIPHPTRSSPHRCCKGMGSAAFRRSKGTSPRNESSRAIRSVIAEVQTAEGKLYLYVAIDRTSKFAFVQLVKTGRTSASAFLEALIAAVPYKIHIVLTDNGVQFTFHRATQTAPPRVT
jgi:hypothetical protein